MAKSTPTRMVGSDLLISTSSLAIWLDAPNLGLSDACGRSLTMVMRPFYALHIPSIPGVGQGVNQIGPDLRDQGRKLPAILNDI